MGISFKLSKGGSRFRPKPSAVTEDVAPAPAPEETARALADAGSKREMSMPEAANNGSYASKSFIGSVAHLLPEREVSFTLTLYQKGYCIGEPTEMETVQPVAEDGKSLHPYDRASETLFAAIQSGWLPSDILDDVPVKYYDGSLICEVRDYRKHGSDQGAAASAVSWVPVKHKVQLKMSLENIVKDMHSISDDSWTYSDLMEVESRILKALQPRLQLDPTPRLDQLCKGPISNKLNLGIGRKRRLVEKPEVIVTSNNQAHGKKVCINKVPDIASCKPGDPGSLLANVGIQQGRENMATQHVPSCVSSFRPNNIGQDVSRSTLALPSHAKLHPGINSPAVMHDRGNGLSANFAGANANMTSSQNLISSFTDSASCNSPIPMKRENPDGQVPLLATKRAKQALGPDGIQSQQAGSQIVGTTGSDMQWKNQLLQQQLDIKGMQYSSPLTTQRYPSPMMNNVPNQEPGSSFYFGQQGLRYGAKEEQIDRQELQWCKDSLQALPTENSALVQQQSQPQNLLQHQFMRNNPPNSAQWQHVRPATEKEMRKDDALQRRKSVPSPRVSSGPMVQSPVSSKSGEISSGSMGGQFSAIGTVSALGSQKDKLTATSNAAIGTPSVTSSPSESVHRQHQGSMVAKRKPNPAPKAQSISGVGSPASVSNMNAPLNANSPSIGTGSVSEQEILERFSKIEVIHQRYQLNSKKSSTEDYPARKPVAHRPHEVAIRLSDSFNNDDYTDQLKTLSKYIISGTINTLKARTVNFKPMDNLYQVSAKPHHRLIMNESSDGTVAMQHRDIDNPDAQDYNLTLPTTHYADLLASQFCVLMERSGYMNSEDVIRPRMVVPSNSLAFSGISENISSEVKPEVPIGQSPQLATSSASVNAMGSLNSQNFSNNTGMLASANSTQGLTMPQGYLPGTSIPARAQQTDQSLLQQQQLQQTAQSQLQHHQQLPLSHMQRSASLLSGNPLSQMTGQTSNIQINANHMINNKPTPFQLQMLQQAQQQQQAQPQRKVMMGPNSSIGLGNMQNNMASLSGLSNVMGLGGVRGISPSMGPVSGLGNISPSQMNLGTASNFGLRGPLTPQQTAAAFASKLRMVQSNRAGAYGPPAIGAMSGSTNQMLPNAAGLSMLGHPLNRTNINTLHRNAMSTMGPPKITGTNFYLNPQQQLQLHQLQQQQLQQQQQQQQQQLQQQQISSPLQHTPVGSPAIVGSPSAMVMQQQISPQQIGQKTTMSPQQLSSGTMQQMNNGGNIGAGPASPQLSSQTHGSVASITSSPMEQLQGANKVGPSNI